MRDTLIVIPTYCERENIGQIAPAVVGAIEADLLVADDDSPDGTADLAEELGRNDPRIQVLQRKGRPRGLGPAYVDAFGWALERGYSFVIQMDADFSHDPVHLGALRAACEDADVAIGSRYVPGGETPGWPLARRLISRGGSLYTRTILGLPIRDTTSGFKCWRAGALRQIGLERVAARGFAFQIEMLYRARQAGLRLVEVPVRFCDRRVGQSKMSAKIFIEGLLAVWRIRFAEHR